MRKTAVRIFIRGFVISLFIVAMLLSIGILSYKLTMNRWQAPKESKATKAKESPTQSITKGTTDDISKNLIYCYDEDSKQVTKLVLEIFNCKNQEITYITIPMRTQLKLSNSLYQKLISVQPAMPQMLQLSVISDYLDYDSVFDYGVLLVEELLDIQISYYTVLPKEIYDEIFISKTDKSNEAQLPIEYFKKEYIKLLRELKTEEDISNYIEELYPKLKSNLSLKDKKKYVESYVLTSVDHISFELVPGENTNSAYFVNPSFTAQRFSEIFKR